jgi:hypothetical protein
MVDGLLVPLDNEEYGMTLPNDTARLFMKMYAAFSKNVVAIGRSRPSMIICVLSTRSLRRSTSAAAPA